LDELVRLYGRPARVRVDNGPELVAEAFVEWCAIQRIGLGYIQPGKPDQNAFIERFNRTYREEVLDAHLFESLDQVRMITSLAMRMREVAAAKVASTVVASRIGACHWTWSPTCTESKPTASAVRAKSTSSGARGTPDE
jgi:transposase InsO family protein